MNNQEKEVLMSIYSDIQTLIIDKNKDDNKYYYDLIINNLKDIIKGKYDKGGLK